MARFLYQARDGNGELATGMISASDMEEAGQLLRTDGKFVVRLSPVNDADLDSPVTVAARARRVRRKEVILFAHQLAVMIETGVPLTDALQCAADQAHEPAFKAVLQDVILQVQAGGEFSAALRKYPKVFPSVMTSLLRASEMSGTMSTMLDRISTYLAKEEQTIRQARGAMLYPCFMMVMALGVTIFLLAFVMPKFAAIYDSRKAVLPAPTQILLMISNGLVNYWYIWLCAAAALVVGVIVCRRTTGGKRFIDWLKLHIPIMKRLYMQLYITRACRTMGTMISAGVSMLDMIAIIKQVTNNAFYADLWDEVDDRLRQGAQLSEPLFHSPLIPRSIAQMVYSGEKSGQLGKVMNRVADYTEIEFDQTVKAVTSMIEPVMVAVMGSIIGFIAISLLLPIFSVGRVVAGS
jgi:type IV pilus assembly protein PilC